MPNDYDAGVVRAAPQLAALLQASDAAAPDEDRARGVLLGLAVGNLLGLPIEGASRAAIARRYPNGVTEIHSEERFRNLDDDLAQAVELAEALLEDDPAGSLAERLIRWMNENGRGIGNMTYEVISAMEDDPTFAKAAFDYWDADGRPETQPNGALMRCPPAAVGYALDAERLIEQTAATCAVTHYAPGAQWSCIVVNVAIAALLRGRRLSRDELAAAALADGAPRELGDWIREIPDAIEDRIDAEEMIGHTYLAMQAALWCLDCEDGFEEALVRIVSAGGDTDTNGAVAGAVLGARYGASAIPPRWRALIPEQARIEQASAALIRRA